MFTVTKVLLLAHYLNGSKIHNYFIFLRITTCGFLCDLPKVMSSKETDALLNTHSYDIHIQSHVDAQRLIYRHIVSSPLMQTMAPTRDQSTSRILINDPHLNTTVTQISDREVFFPAPRLYQMDCNDDFNNTTCRLGDDGVFIGTQNMNADFQFRLRISHEVQTTPHDVRSYWVKAIATRNNTKPNGAYYGIDRLTCKDNFDEVI